MFNDENMYLKQYLTELGMKGKAMFLSGLKPALLLGRCIGFAPKICNTNQTILTLYSISIAATYVTIVLYSSTFSSEFKEIYIRNVNKVLYLYMSSSLGLVLGVAFEMRMSTNYMDICRKIRKIDRKFLDVTRHLSYEKINKEAFITFTVRGVFLGIVLCLRLILTQSILKLEYLHLLVAIGIVATPQIYNFLLTFLVIYYVKETGRRYSLLNKQLTEYGRKKCRRNAIWKLNKICQMHQELALIVKEISETFGFVMVLSFAVSFIAITVGLYSNTQTLTIGNNNSLIAVAFSAYVTYFIDTVLMCYNCEAAMKKVGRHLHTHS